MTDKAPATTQPEQVRRQKHREAASERAINVLRDIGYPCQLWRSGDRVGIVIDYQAADRLIQVHRPGYRASPLSPTEEGVKR